jgi:glycosyltransferase involved in cell wall biosynthesis
MYEDPRVNDDPRILVLAPDWDFASGGVRKLYRHVDVLRKHGLNAYIEHQNPGFRCKWFENDTAIADPRDTWPPRPQDVLLCAEQVSWQMVKKTPGIAKVIFNQGAYLTFKGKTDEFNVLPYTHEDFLATIVVSEDSRQYLNYAFPGHPVFRIHNSIDPRHFFYEPNKKPKISFMPRKNDSDVTQVLLLLMCRAKLEGFELKPIQHMNESQVGVELRESVIFLSLSAQEGSPMPPLEALACGCITVGYDGLGGREYLNSEYGFPVVQSDVQSFAKTLERVVRGLREQPAPLLEKARRAATFVYENYSPQREEQDIVGVWELLLRHDRLAQFRPMPG